MHVFCCYFRFSKILLLIKPLLVNEMKSERKIAVLYSKKMINRIEFNNGNETEFI